MHYTLFKFAIIFCVLDLVNLPYLGTFLDAMSNLSQIWFWFWTLIITGFIGGFRKEFGPMGYSDIFVKFLRMFPHYADEAVQWAPAGKNEIRVKLKDGTGLTFKYTDDVRWDLTSDVSYYGRRG